VIVAAKRTPIGRNLGALSDIKPPLLGGIALTGTLKSINFSPKDVSVIALLKIGRASHHG